MTTIAFFDCPTGLSGDMCLGALVGAGVPLPYLIDRLAGLGVSAEYHLASHVVLRQGQAATKVDVICKTNRADRSQTQNEQSHSTVDRPHSHASHDHSHDHGHAHDHGHSHDHDHSHDREPTPPHPHDRQRNLPEIEGMIRRAKLPAQVVDWAIAVFRQLAIAEGAVHGIPPEQVHFHEVGAIDAIVDIVGTCLGLDYLGVTDIHCSALPIGGGTVWAAHGRLPVPAPATLKLFEFAQVPLYSNGIEKELVTPTGAAIVTALATGFGPMPPLTLQRVGLGAGNHDLPIPNILRLWIGKPEGTIAPSAHLFGSDSRSPSQPQAQSQPQVQPQVQPQSPQRREPIVLLETQLDDMTPQAIGFVQGELLAKGALDVFTQAIAMKKNRPGVLLSVICRPEQADEYEAWLLVQTTTLGVRRSVQDRAVLYRQITRVETDYGPVRMKVAWSEAQALKVHPEYEDCAAIARAQDLPLMEVQRAALAAWAIAPWVPGSYLDQPIA